MAFTATTAALLAMLALFLLSSTEAQSSAGAAIAQHITLPHRVEVPNAPHHSLCATTKSAICNSVAARLPVVTPWTLAEAIIGGAQTKALRASTACGKLSMDPTFDRMTQLCFAQCSQEFNGMDADLETALEALRSGDRDTAKSNIDAASDGPESCSDCFEDDAEDVPHAAEHLVKNLKKWAKNILDINLSLLVQNLH